MEHLTDKTSTGTPFNYQTELTNLRKAKADQAKKGIILNINNKHNKLSQFTLKCSAHISSSSPIHIIIHILIDTCSLQANYVAQSLIDRLGKNTILKNNLSTQACGVGGCASCSTLAKFNLTFFNNLNNIYETIEIIAFVLPNIETDLILGRPTISKYKILSKTPLEGNYYELPPGTTAVDSTSNLDSNSNRTTVDINTSTSHNHEICYMCESSILKINSIEHRKHSSLGQNEVLRYIAQPEDFSDDILRDNMYV